MPFRLDVWEIVGRDRLDRHCNYQRTDEENERARWLQTQSFPPSPPAFVSLVPRASREHKRVHNRCSKTTDPESRTLDGAISGRRRGPPGPSIRAPRKGTGPRV